MIKRPWQAADKAYEARPSAGVAAIKLSVEDLPQ